MPFLGLFFFDNLVTEYLRPLKINSFLLYKIAFLLILLPFCGLVMPFEF